MSKINDHIDDWEKDLSAKFDIHENNINDIIDSIKNGIDLQSSFIKNMPACVAAFDLDMKYIAASDMWLESFNLTNVVIGKSHYEIFPSIKKEKPEWVDLHKRCFQGEMFGKSKEAFDDKIIRWRIWPIKNKAGDVIGQAHYSEDLTNFNNE